MIFSNDIVFYNIYQKPYQKSSTIKIKTKNPYKDYLIKHLT
jgi:hypothetical protein